MGVPSKVAEDSASFFLLNICASLRFVLIRQRRKGLALPCCWARRPLRLCAWVCSSCSKCCANVAVFVLIVVLFVFPSDFGFFFFVHGDRRVRSWTLRIEIVLVRIREETGHGINTGTGTTVVLVFFILLW